MNKIKGYCRTNLDDYQRYDWPTIFAAVPRIGDRVKSVCGTRVLKVVGITHTMISYEAVIEVELNR